MATPSAEKIGIFRRAMTALSPVQDFKKAGKEHADSLLQRAAKAKTESTKLYGAANEVTQLKKDKKLDAETLKGLKKKYSGTVKPGVMDDEEVITNLGNTALEKSGKYKQRVENMQEQGAFKGTNLAGKGEMLGRTVKNYYDPRGKSVGTNALRYGMTAGVTTAGAIGGRYISGGTMTRNSDGEKDIAGIPFI